MLEPYFSESRIQIYCGDAVDVVAALGRNVFSCVITDPPFSSGARTDAGKAVRGAMVRGARWENNWFSRDNLATVGFVYLMRLSCLTLFESAAESAAAHFFIDWRMFPHLYGAAESAGWAAKNCVVWDKGSFGMGSNYRNQHELILYAEKGSPQIHDRGVGNVLRYARAECTLHPTEKPVPLLERLILATTEEGDTVLDPFCGSGSVLRAAANTGRRAIGVEIEERYCEIAARRLEQGILF